jgi:hypothetical protein
MVNNIGHNGRGIINEVSGILRKWMRIIMIKERMQNKF